LKNRFFLIHATWHNSLNVLHNYFDGTTKLFSVFSEVFFLDILAQSFFPYNVKFWWSWTAE